MGVLEAVIGLPLEVRRDRTGSAVVGRAGCCVTAGASAVEVRAINVAVVDSFGVGAHRTALGVTVPGLLEPQAAVRVRPGQTVEVSVWFEPVSLGDAHHCRVVVELMVGGLRTVAASETVIVDSGPTLAR